MNQNLIFSHGGDRVKPKPVARMFEPLHPKNITCPWVALDYAVGKACCDGCGDHLLRNGICGPCEEERNRKERKEECGKASAASPNSSPSINHSCGLKTTKPVRATFYRFFMTDGTS